MDKLAARAFFIPSYFYNVTLKSVGLRDWFNQIEEKIVLGALPSAGTLKEVSEQFQVTDCLTLNEDHELGDFYGKSEDFTKYNIKVKRVVITDFVGVPSDEQINEGADYIHEVVTDTDRSRCIYVHCKAGRSRSSMILGAYYMKYKNMTAEEAYKFMKEKRTCVDWHGTHWTTMNSYEQKFKGAGIEN